MEKKIAFLDCTCETISENEWKQLMKNKKPKSYKKFCKLIKEYDPEFYERLSLQFWNPYKGQTYETPTHYIFTHSAIEYFFRKAL